MKYIEDYKYSYYDRLGYCYCFIIYNYEDSNRVFNRE